MTKIVCEWEKINKFLINPDGQVYPCCYLSNATYQAKNNEDETKEWWTKNGINKHYSKSKHLHIMKKYYEFEEELNIFNNSIIDILNHEWFQKILPESWKDDEYTHKECMKMCSHKE